MSEIFAFDELGQRRAAEDANANLVDASQATPGLFDNLPKAIGMGLERAVPSTFKSLDILASAPVAAYENLINQPGKWTDAWYKNVDDTLNGAIDYWTADPASTGAASQIIGQFAGIPTELLLGGGSPVAILANAQVDTSLDLLKQGVDAKTASEAGLLAAASTAVGFHAPILGKTLLTRTATGALSFPAVNAAGGVALNEYLKAHGYDEAAAGINPFDLKARGSDALAGLFFGALAHIGAPKGPTKAETDAILTYLDAKHFQHDTAPGTPADAEAFVAHQDAMEQAIGQLLRGEPVTAPEPVQSALFEPKEGAPLPEIPPDLRALDAARTTAETPVTTAAESIVNPIDRTATAPEKVAALQALTEESKPAVRALIADLNKIEGTRSSDSVKAPEKILEKSQRPSIRAEKPWFDVEHVRDSYRFKTVIDRIDRLPQIAEAFARHGFQVVKVDTEKLLKPGPWGWRMVALDLRAPSGQLIEWYAPLEGVEIYKKAEGHALFEKWRNRKITELSDEEMAAYLRDQTRSRASYQAAFEADLAVSGETPETVMASLRKFEASFGSTETQPSRSPVTPSDSLSARQEPPTGRMALTPTPSTNTRPPSDLSTSGSTGESIAKTGSSREPSSQAAGRAESPIVSAARAAALTHPDLMVPTGEYNADGSPVVMSIKDLMAQGDAEIAKATNDAKAYEAVANCFLSTDLAA